MCAKLLALTSQNAVQVVVVWNHSQDAELATIFHERNEAGSSRDWAFVVTGIGLCPIQ